MGRIKWQPLIISLVISLGTGILASLLNSDSIDIYESVYRAPLTPPSCVFPLVWTVLYILMGIAAYLVYVTDGVSDMDRKSALIYYVAQLIANGIWPFIFFNLQMYPLAFVWLILLWYLVYITIRKFCEINKTAAYLMIPYIIWLTFAAYLNLAIAINS